jgi:hypothetical protein
MSTHAIIVAKLQNNTFAVVYLYHDGDPDEAGYKLKTHYNTQSTVDALMALGDIITLRESVEACEFFCRDRGEKLGLLIDTCLESVLDGFETDTGKYFYFWNGSVWKQLTATDVENLTVNYELSSRFADLPKTAQSSVIP